MQTINREMDVCGCCVMVIANADESGCRDYWHHDHPTCDLPASTVIEDPCGGDERWFEWTCDGCGTTQLPGAVAWRAVDLNA